MKTPSTELFDLVHSLGLNEKRYFHLFSDLVPGKEDRKSYLRLVQKINQQSVYHEKQARKASGVQDAARFKRLKNYTQEMLLRSLENYYAGSTIEIQIARRLIQVEILYQKKQITLAKKCLAKARQMAERYDRLFDLAKCLEWQSRIANATANARTTLDKEFLRKSRETTEQCTRWVELRRFNNELWTIIHEANEIDSYYRKKLKWIVTETLKIISPAGTGITLQKEGYGILSVAYRFLGDWDKSIFYRREFLKLFENDLQHLHYYAAEYMVALGNLINACRETRRFEEMDQLYDKAIRFREELPQKYITLRFGERFLSVLNGYATSLYQRKRYTESLKQAELLLPELHKHDHTFQNTLETILYKTLMYSAFFSGQYKKCIQYYNQLSNLPERIREEYPYFYLAALYENGDRDLLYYKARSLRYKLSRRKETTQEEKDLVKLFLSGLSSTSGRQNEIEILEKISAHLDAHPHLKKGFGDLSVPLWIRSRRSRRTIEEIGSSEM